MQVQEIMSRPVHNVATDATCAHAAEKMRDHEVGFLAVTNATPKLAGVVTDRDLVVRGIANHKAPETTKVVDVMTDEYLTIDQDADTTLAAQLMDQNQVRRLLVTSGPDGIVGVVTLGDLAKGTHDAALCGHVVEQVSTDRSMRSEAC